MSELINNREKRKEILKQLILELHDGKTVDDVKERFEREFGNVSASEISEAEQALIHEGLPVSEVQRLCDVHSAVFKGSIEEIHRAERPEDEPGHPVWVLKAENRAIEKVLGRIGGYTMPGDAAALAADLIALRQIDAHYKKKENILFPMLESRGIYGPPKVMWGVDDEIRNLVKDAVAALKAQDFAKAHGTANEASARIAEMIFKEENILLPMLLENLTPEEWGKAALDSPEIGYALIADPPKWAPAPAAEPRKEPAKEPERVADGTIRLPSGVLKAGELIGMLNTLPFDITFVDTDDTVKYFSQGPDRIFARTTAIIGRKVTNCHPPQSVHIVEKIIADFKSGVKDHEDFWIKMGPRYVLIRYFAVRNEAGEYLGTLEVTQDIGPIQAIDGEKRLLS